METRELIENQRRDLLLRGLFKQSLKDQFRRTCWGVLVPRFWNHCKEDSDPLKMLNSFCEATSLLHGEILSFTVQIQADKSLDKQIIDEMLGEVLLSVASVTTPPHFETWLNGVLSISCDLHLRLNGVRLESFQVNNPFIDYDEHLLEEVWEQFKTALKILAKFNLEKLLCTYAVVEALHCKIKQFIHETCKEDFETQLLSDIESLVQQHLMKWLCDMPGLVTEESKAYWENQLKYFAFKTFAEVRISMLFEIIVEFPDSKPALFDLKKTLEYVDLWDFLIQSLKSSFEKRLLHPGASTADIITQYISTIKCLKILDISGKAADKVCTSIKAYLSTRNDTVRCIVSSLLDDSGSDLQEALANPKEDTEERMLACVPEWIPDAPGAKPALMLGEYSGGRDSVDILSVLMQIYGNMKLFVKEYCHLLSDRLLSSMSFEITREVHNLEILKCKFGESNLLLCDIMLKDIVDSRRFANAIAAEQQASTTPTLAFPVEAFILSHLFWQTLHCEELELPVDLLSALKGYTKQYQKLKGMRTLEWKSYLGLVDLEVTIGDKTLEFSVPPPKAVIIFHFQEKDRWTLDELNKATKLSHTSLRKHLSFWVAQEVIKEIDKDTFTSVDAITEEEEELYKGQLNIDELESVDDIQTLTPQEDSELESLWNYIGGMLTNLGSMPLEKLHSMLQMFAMPGSDAESVTLAKLKRFLDGKVVSGQLIYLNSTYSLPS